MKKHLILSLLAVVFGLTACKKYFGDVNTNPNSPNIVEPKVMLPGIEAAISFSFGGDAARYSGILTQQVRGDDRQFKVIQDYKFTGNDVESLYETNIYTKILMEIKGLKDVSLKNGYHHYNGIAKTLEAYTLLFVADFWDSAPYSDAFKGVNSLQPKYDSHAELYATVFRLLSEARVDLGQTDGGAKQPKDEGSDIFYNGDVTKWAELTNFIEARANLRLAKADPSKYQTALNLLSTGLSSDFAFPYSGGAFGNPMFQFNTQWGGSLVLGDKITELLTNYNDPRLPMYNQGFDDLNTYFVDNKPHVIGSIIEQEFIKAECNFQTGGSGAALPFYTNAITLALERDGVSPADIATYLGQATVNPGAITLELIINQKYLALFMEHETFTDWRRTGFPTLTPNNGSAIPRRFPTPQSELNLNAPNAPTSTIYKAVTWDI
jgi:hypothetical protein